MSREIGYIILLLFVAGLTVSCNRDPIPASQMRVVDLSVEEEMNSRAVVTTAEDNILSLGIFGYSTGTSNFDPNDSFMLPNLFANRMATRTDALSPWEYDPLAYWPLDLNVNNTFFAYSPYIDDFPGGENSSVSISVSDESTPGFPYINYKVNVETDVSDLVDLLYSELNGDVRDINSSTNDGKVKYKMKHAFAWIRFLIVPTIEQDENGAPERDASYAVTELYFSGGNIVNGGRLNLCTGVWINMTYGPVEYSFDHLQEGNGFQEISVIGGAQFLGSFDNCLMVFPQDIVYSVNKTSVLVSYWYDKDGQPDPITGKWDDTEYYVTLPFPDVKLKAGSVMTYIVKLSTSGAWIEFHSENSIEKWLEDPGYIPPVIEVF